MLAAVAAEFDGPATAPPDVDAAAFAFAALGLLAPFAAALLPAPAPEVLETACFFEGAADDVAFVLPAAGAFGLVAFGFAVVVVVVDVAAAFGGIARHQGGPVR